MTTGERRLTLTLVLTFGRRQALCFGPADRIQNCHAEADLGSRKGTQLNLVSLEGFASLVSVYCIDNRQ